MSLYALSFQAQFAFVMREMVRLHKKLENASNSHFVQLIWLKYSNFLFDSQESRAVVRACVIREFKETAKWYHFQKWFSEEMKSTRPIFITEPSPSHYVLAPGSTVAASKSKSPPGRERGQVCAGDWSGLAFTLNFLLSNTTLPQRLTVIGSLTAKHENKWKNFRELLKKKETVGLTKRKLIFKNWGIRFESLHCICFSFQI